jgi:hypothetical protein
MVKTRNYGRRKAKKHTLRRRYKTSFRKHRSVRKRRTKQKRKRGGYQEVDLYLRDLETLKKAQSPESVKQACEQIQSSLGPKYKSFGCRWQLNQDNIQECRQGKENALTDINRFLLEKKTNYEQLIHIVDYPPSPEELADNKRDLELAIEAKQAALAEAEKAALSDAVDEEHRHAAEAADWALKVAKEKENKIKVNNDRLNAYTDIKVVKLANEMRDAIPTITKTMEIIDAKMDGR